MNSDTRKLLEAVQQGTMSVDEALLAIKKEPFADIGYAKVDMHRGIRQGAAEVIYGAGKTPEQIAGIVEAMKKREQETILITRVDEEKSRETERLLADKGYLESVYRAGAEKAAYVANRTLSKVYKKVGFLAR